MVKYPPIDPEDLNIWEEVVKTVKPLNKQLKPKGSNKKLIIKPHKQLIIPSYGVSSAAKIEAKIDLHGYTQIEAFDILEKFISRCYRMRKKRVLVITGKGKSLGENWWENQGVLQQQVPRWLEVEPNKSKISSVQIADPQHGGAGALIIVLR